WNTITSAAGIPVEPADPNGFLEGETGQPAPPLRLRRSPCHDPVGPQSAGDLPGTLYSRPRDRAARVARAASRGRQSGRAARERPSHPRENGAHSPPLFPPRRGEIHPPGEWDRGPDRVP